MDIPRYWRLREQRYQLKGTKCLSCGKLFFPQRRVCSKCKSLEMEKVLMPTAGKVYSFSIVYQTSRKFEMQVPYVVALIELQNGVRLTAQLTDVEPQNVQIGLPVEMVIRKYYEEGENGPIMYGYKFRPTFRAKK